MKTPIENFTQTENEVKASTMARIQKELGNRNIKNRDIADLFNIEESTVSNWTRRNTVNLSFLSALHTQYGIDLNYLICGDEGKNLFNEKEMAILTNAYAILSKKLHKL